jgi:hypothetical protein
MTAVSWDRKRVLMMIILGTRDHNNAWNVLWNIKGNCLGPSEQKNLRVLTSCAALLHENALPHTAACIWALLDHSSLELFDRSLYSPDLTASDFLLFSYLKNWLRPQHFSNNDELM